MPSSNLQWLSVLWVSEIQVNSRKNRDTPIWVEWNFISSFVIYTFMKFVNWWGVLASMIHKLCLMLVQLQNLLPSQCHIWGYKTWYLLMSSLLNSSLLLAHINPVHNSIHQNLIHKPIMLHPLLYFSTNHQNQKMVLWLTLWTMNYQWYKGQNCVVFMHMYHIPTMSFLTSARNGK